MVFSSLGLANPPRIRFLQRSERRKCQVQGVQPEATGVSTAGFNDSEESDDDFLTIKKRNVQATDEGILQLNKDLQVVNPP